MSQLWKHRVVKLDLQRFGNTVERIQPELRSVGAQGCALVSVTRHRRWMCSGRT